MYRHRDHTLFLGYQGKVTSHALLRTLFKHFSSGRASGMTGLGMFYWVQKGLEVYLI